MALIWQWPSVETGNVYAQAGERRLERGGQEARESDVNESIVGQTQRT
jgi:hypothetical protein